MAVQITESMLIKGKTDEIFQLWTDLEMLPSIIQDIKEVKRIGELTSEWVVKGPLGKDYRWTAEVTRFDEDRRIAWRTLEGDIKTSGQVTFKDLPDDMTEMTVLMQYVPPAGKLGDMVSKVLENPHEKITEGMRDFKAFAENMPERIRKSNKTKT